MHRLAAALFVATVAAGYGVTVTSSAVIEPRIRSSPSTFLRACGTDVWGDLGPVRRWQRESIILGPCAFVAIRGARTASKDSIRRAYRAGRGAFKILALVQRGRTVTVSVPPAGRRHVALLYDPSAFNRPQTIANGEHAVTFRACPPDGAGAQDWSAATQFNGGIIVDSPRCVELTVRIGIEGPARKIAAPFGRVSCPP